MIQAGTWYAPLYQYTPVEFLIFSNPQQFTEDLGYIMVRASPSLSSPHSCLCAELWLDFHALLRSDHHLLGAHPQGVPATEPVGRSSFSLPLASLLALISRARSKA